MAERAWTKAQKAAIEDEGGSLLVSAAAGSGKTAVLVERAVRMVTRETAPLPADKLLILTFTNAAADELRGRIGARIEQELRARPHDTALRRQRMLLRRAFIGTIDAFCMQLVREHFAQLGVAPDVVVGDAALLGQLSDLALAEVMEEMSEDENFARFTALYGRARSDDEAARVVLELYGYTRTLPRPQAVLDGFVQMYEETRPLAQTAWGEGLLRHAGRALAAAGELLGSALQTVREEPELAPYEDALCTALGDIEAMRAAVAAGNWDAACARVQGYAFPAFKPVRGCQGPAKERVITLRDEAKKILADLAANCFVCSEAQFEQDRAAALPLIRAMVAAVRLYERLFDEGKQREKILDFSDFEQMALRLLRGEDGAPTPVAQRVAARYGAVMVDEYQDTNELQSALYECLGNEAGSNLFYVGDVKQSIYRFRKANPGIFLDKMGVWAPFESGERPAVLRLGHNFRSSEAVIGGVNYLFGQLMSEQLGEVAYGEQERLISGGSSSSACGETAAAEVCVVRDENASDAAWVARRIRQMVRDGARVRDGEGTRPCGYGDFCILLRARTRMADYVQALEERGVPVVSDLAEELLQTPEVLPLRAVIAAIDNPGDDVQLAAALLGPLFRFTLDEVTALREATPRGGLWGALLRSGGVRVQGFVRRMGHYRALATQMSAGRLCETLVEETGYLSAVAAMEGGAQRRENLLRFIGWAKEVSASGRGTLQSFVRLMDGGRVPDAPGFKGVAGHVSLLSVHKSKGLEFPIVFLADAGRQFFMGDLASRVLVHSRLGVGLWLRSGEYAKAGYEGGTLYPTLPLLAIKRAHLDEALSEEMRVLYVALTRAKDRVVVSCGHRDPEGLLVGMAATQARPPEGETAGFLLARARSMAGWVLAAALRHPDAVDCLRQAGVETAVPPCETDCRLGVAICENNETEQSSGEAAAFALTAEPEPAFVHALTDGFARQPARLSLAGLPAKVSVSQLAKAETPGVRKRPSFMYRSGLTAAERGTAMHAFLQHADYACAASGLEEEIGRLAEAGVLSAEAAKALDRRGIGAFLASPLARRMTEASCILREYDFITAIEAGMLDKGLAVGLAGERVLVQGIVDAVLLGGGRAEIVDYKTDRGKTPGQLADAYQGQLALYRQAVQKRLCLPVDKLTIWSFELAQEVDIPLQGAAE